MVLFFVFFFSFRVTLVPTKMLLLLILGMQTTFFLNKEGEAKKRKRRRLDIKNITLAFKSNSRFTLLCSYIVVCSETVSVVTVAFRGLLLSPAFSRQQLRVFTFPSPTSSRMT